MTNYRELYAKLTGAEMWSQKGAEIREKIVKLEEVEGAEAGELVEQLNKLLAHVK
jgi:hypothetical protein